MSASESSSDRTHPHDSVGGTMPHNEGEWMVDGTIRPLLD
ncbi:hypothetical protein RISK_000397 [Rhodopirellula islandica]|uniref:Uncharacterized protein n=1 Tax=Rhodopirellula islandica TaxID=595434 RepID=A0A0J1EPB0_RHOIS|nr:hypothetical protein RISK_000397 [Rhodopirellula islandica]